MIKTGYSQKYSFINYSTKEGLAQSQVNDIKQDKNKYLWVATLDGLSKFNGISFENFYMSDGLLSNRINSLSVDKQDRVWAVTDQGISIVSADSIVSFSHNEKFAEADVLEVIHHEDKIWISTVEKGIYCFIKKNKKFELYHIFKRPTEDFKVKDIFRDGYKIYVATNKGLYYIFNTNLTKVSMSVELDLTSIGVTKLGKIWLGTSENGVYFLDKNNVHPITQDNSDLFNGFITNLLVDESGNAWVCSNTALSEVNQNKQVQNYTAKNGFEGTPKVIFQDAEGNFWIGTNGQGLVKFANKEFKFLTKRENLPANLIISIAEDEKGNIWMGSYGEGISRIDRNGVANFNARQSNLPSDICWTIKKDLKDRLWLGTSEGLSLFQNGKFKTYTEEDGLPHNKVQSIFQEVPDVLWIGTRKGVAYFKDSKFTLVNDYPFTQTRAITSTQDGMYWFGTSEGLVSYDGFEANLIEDSLLLNNKVYSLASLGNRIWLGTEKGLIYFDGSQFERINFSSENSFPIINFLKIDNDNELWFGTNKGVFRLDLNLFLKGKKNIQSYSENNGLIGMETNINAIFQDSENNIWMGTSEGVNIYRKSQNEDNSDYDISIHLTNIKLFFEEKNWLGEMKKSSKLKFGNKKNTFTFYYQTNYFKDPSKVKYSYKLDGLGDDWSPMEAVNFSRYPNLSYGDYTFMVKSTIDGKNWSETEKISFTINRPYWLTWWFRIGVLFLFFGIVFYFIIRRRNTLRQEREVELLNYKNKLIKLEQQSLNASMNRHFIFNSLNSIQFYINKEDKLSANRYLSNFSKLIRKNLDSSSVEDNLIPLSEEIERLNLYLSLENMRFKEKFTYEINIEDEVDVELTKVPGMFMQPFIENSIWHGVLPMEEIGEITINIFRA